MSKLKISNSPPQKGNILNKRTEIISKYRQRKIQLSKL